MASARSRQPEGGAQGGGTKVSFHMEYVSNHESFLVPHTQNGWVQVFDSAYVGGGERGWYISYAVVEPASEEEVERSVPDLNSKSAYLARLPTAEG